MVVLGGVEGYPLHHPASVPGRMDVSWRRVCVYELVDSQSVPERSSPAHYGSMCCPSESSSVQSGWLNPKRGVNVKGWVDKKEGLRVRN